MKPAKKAFLILSLTSALATPAFAHDDKEKEEKVEWANVPAAVQATITGHASGGQVISVDKDVERDGVEYEAKVKGTDGKMTDVSVKADGTFIKAEADDQDEHGEHHGKDKGDKEDKDDDKD